MNPKVGIWLEVLMGGRTSLTKRLSRAFSSLSVALTVISMAIRAVEFSNGGYKIRRVFALESTYSKEIIEF